MKLKLILFFIPKILLTKHGFSNLGWLDQDSCIPMGTACFGNGLAHFYSMFHFNGRYRGPEMMRIPFSLAINASVPGAI